MRAGSLLATIALACLATLAAAGELNPRDYERSQVLSSFMTIYWNVDVAANNITIAVQAQTTGWIGLGLSANGGMYGADVFVYSFTGKQWTLQDRFASGFFQPNLDASQDLILLDYGQTDNSTYFVFSRNITTCDPQDFDFREQGNGVIFAHGNSDMFSYHGTSNRGASYVHFLDDPTIPPLPSDAQRIQVRMPNVSIPNNMTDYYVCTAAKLPSDQKYQRGPIIDNTPFVHHMLVYSCLTPPPVTDGETWPCFSMVSQCSGAFSGWAPGAGNFSFPPNAGLPFGTKDTVIWIVLQVHYNNPSRIGGQIDSSGFEFVYTSQLRQYDVGSIILGANLPLINLPPGIPNNTITAECASGCFAQYLPPTGVTVLSLGFHMHLLGRKSWVQHIRNGSEIGNISSQEWFNFNYQASQPIAYNQTLLPGDSLISHCVWDTTGVNQTTLGGEDTGDEMCYQFLLYYPATPVRLCIDLSDVIPETTYCATAAQILTHEWSNKTSIPYDAPYVPLPPAQCHA